MAVAITTNKNKKNTGTYAQWVTDAETNAKIENTDQTPSAASNFWSKWNAAVGSAVQGAASGAGVDVKYGVASPGKVDATGAPIGSPTTPYTETEGFAKWVADNGFTYENGKINTAPTVTTPTTTTPEAGGTGKEETKIETETKTPVTDESGFTKWIETDPAMQARMRQAESDYYRNRAGYGVQGENLAQSGLIGSGWNSHMDATAYAAMQAEKAGVRSEGYAKWLGDQEAAKAESTAAAEGLNTDAQTVFSYLVEQGKNSVTDTDLSYLYGLGFSKDAIDKAVTAYNDYSAKNKSEVSNTFKDSLNTLMGEGTAADFLGSLGISTEGMTDDEINATTDAAIEQAFKDGTLTAEDRSAYYKAGQILDEDMAGWSADDVMTNAVNSVTNARTMLDDGKLTESDYKEIVDAAYKAINVQNLHLAGVAAELGLQSAADMIQFTVDIDGKKTTYTADMVSVSGSKVDKDSNLAKALSAFGKASLAVYDGKVYYQYEDGAWVEVSTKALTGSAGSKKDGDKILRVIAEYYAANHIKIGDGQSKGRR